MSKAHLFNTISTKLLKYYLCTSGASCEFVIKTFCTEYSMFEINVNKLLKNL